MTAEPIADLIDRLLASPPRDRDRLRLVIRGRLLTDPDRPAAVLSFLTACIERGGADGLEVAIDVLKALPITAVFLITGFPRADLRPGDEDRWYVLLRALGRSAAPDNLKLRVLGDAAQHEAPIVREAAAHALGDVGTLGAEARLGPLRYDPSELVRDAARRVLADLQDA